MQTEIWKPIEELNGRYEVSNLGRIRSVDRIIYDAIGRKRKWKGSIIAASYCSNGYTKFCPSYKGKAPNQMIHRIVGKAFLPNPKGKPTINHKNGKRDDNRVDNLEWATYSENHIDKYQRSGKGHKLTIENIISIRGLLAANVNPKIIANQFNVKYGTIYRIKNKKSWHHVH